MKRMGRKVMKMFKVLDKKVIESIESDVDIEVKGIEFVEEYVDDLERLKLFNSLVREFKIWGKKLDEML
jgi:hypothetical protein